MTVFITKQIKSHGYYFLGILLIIVCWQLLSIIYDAVFIPSPRDTLVAIITITKNGELKENVLISLMRQLTGLSIGVLVGISVGVVAGIFKKLEMLFQPFINLLLAVPAIVFVVMAMVWFGIGTKMNIFLVALLVFPVMYTNTIAGFHSIDKSLLEMAKVYLVPKRQLVFHIYFPSMVQALIAGFSLSMASSVRLTVMSELLGAREGIGQKIAIARTYLETDYLFAWIIVLILILLSMEFLFIRPLRKFTDR